MLLKELHEYFGTWANLSRELRLGNSTYLSWRKKGYIPYTTQLVIEKKTKGKFLANEKHGKPSE